MSQETDVGQFKEVRYSTSDLWDILMKNPETKKLQIPEVF